MDMDRTETEPLLLACEGPVAWLTFNRPDAMNALTLRVMELLGDKLDEIEGDPAIRAVALTGAGKAFCAGVDLTALGGDVPADEATARFMEVAGPVAARLSSFPKPTIAAVNGLALAGGLEMVLNCDLAIASSRARFGDAHANFGLIPGGGSSVKLPRRIGTLLAKYLIYTGEFMDAKTMQSAGLVLNVVEPERLHDEVQALGFKLGEKSPLGLARSKMLVNTGAELPEAEAIVREATLAIEHSGSDDAIEGMAAFKAKRKPNFTGK